ncbi:MAG: LytTR family DNA-binding domain-containing protein [Streptococcus sp.]|nr:LytTR family DNA-binding domain-containing protein [Streptococcus sp.]
MKIKFRINPELPNQLVILEANLITEKLKQLSERLLREIEQSNRLIIQHKGQILPIKLENIYRIFTENRKLSIRLEQNCYAVNERLYQIQEQLSSRFIKISQSEFVNLDQISHLELLKNGLIKIIMKNDDVTYSSRRYLKSIKEELGL